MIRPPPLNPHSALFLDVDGTLLEIAPRPELVHVPSGLPDLLKELTRQRNGALALISGRPIAELDRLFRPWRGAAAATALASVGPALAECERRWPGVWIEDKGRTVALHYRAIPEKEAEIRDAMERLAQDESGPLRLIAGKMVFELQPGHRHKGAVIAAFLAEPPFRGPRAVFIGDDTTDEDGFAEVNRRGGISIRVGAPAPTAAVYDLASVADALDWLDAAAKG